MTPLFTVVEVTWGVPIIIQSGRNDPRPFETPFAPIALARAASLNQGSGRLSPSKQHYIACRIVPIEEEA